MVHRNEPIGRLTRSIVRECSCRLIELLRFVVHCPFGTIGIIHRIKRTALIFADKTLKQI